MKAQTGERLSESSLAAMAPTAAVLRSLNNGRPPKSKKDGMGIAHPHGARMHAGEKYLTTVVKKLRGREREGGNDWGK